MMNAWFSALYFRAFCAKHDEAEAPDQENLGFDC